MPKYGSSQRISYTPIRSAPTSSALPLPLGSRSFIASSASVSSVVVVGMAMPSWSSHARLIHSITWRSCSLSSGSDAMRPSSSVITSRHSGWRSSSALRLGMYVSIIGARSMMAPLSSSAISCARERFALKSTSVCTSPFSIASSSLAYSFSSDTPCACTLTRVSASMRAKNLLSDQLRSTYSVSRPVIVRACAQQAPRHRIIVSSSAAVFFIIMSASVHKSLT